MEYFQLVHPPGQVVICDDVSCNNVASCLEVNERGNEYRACAVHTSCDEHFPKLLKRAPNPAIAGADAPHKEFKIRGCRLLLSTFASRLVRRCDFSFLDLRGLWHSPLL